MGAIPLRIEPDAGDPLFQDAGILPGREVWATMDTAGKEIIGLGKVLLPDLGHDGLAGLLGHLELDRATGLLLHYRGAILDAFT